MQRLFKNSKQILAFVFAFVILAMSLFTGNISIKAEACDVSKIDYWDGTLATKFAVGKGTEDNPYIISTAEELAYCCLGLGVARSSNYYFKVDDNVKTFVMQPESIVDLDVLLNLESPDAVKDYFDGLEGKINWISKFNRQSFNGNFDGNGATVYGLYATYVGTENSAGVTVEDIGLFPQYDGGVQIGNRRYTNTCKNIAVKNSYYNSRRRLGGIAGASYLTGYGAKFDGKVTIDSCAVVNCYMEAVGGWPYFGEQGVIACGGAKDVIVLENILVKDVYAYNTERSANINIVGGSSDVKKSGKYQATVTDSIFLGTAPYGVDCYNDKVHQPYSYTNVVTDLPSGVVDLATPTWQNETVSMDYTDHIFSVTETGVAFKAAANMLDWKNTWFMGANGPELRVFHNNLELITTYTTHLWKCDCCGLESAGGVTEHSFVLVGDQIKGDGSDVYMCSECEYICAHNEQTAQSFDPGDCVTASGVYTRCKFCDWYIVTDVGGIPGHKFTHIEKNIGDCETLGNKEYWECSVCENKFATDDTMAPMNTAVSDEWISTGFGPHKKECNDQGDEIILYDDNGHWYKCSVNGGRLDYDSNDLGEDGYIKHKFKDSECIDCGYVCKDHNYQATGNTTVAHSCTNDEESEIKCTRCGKKTSVVTKAASHTIIKVEKVLPNDRTEGTKEHYKCDVCKQLYLDAEGKTKAEKASLVIPKVLSEEYLKQIGADLGYTSPSTNDSLASVLSVLALAGVALVMTRKVKR